MNEWLAILLFFVVLAVGFVAGMFSYDVTEWLLSKWSPEDE